MVYLATELSKPRIAQRMAVLLLLFGLALLLVEVRFEHQAVLGKKWQAWIPIAYTSIMLVGGGVGLATWERGGRMRGVATIRLYAQLHINANRCHLSIRQDRFCVVGCT